MQMRLKWAIREEHDAKMPDSVAEEHRLFRAALAASCIVASCSWRHVTFVIEYRPRRGLHIAALKVILYVQAYLRVRVLVCMQYVYW